MSVILAFLILPSVHPFASGSSSSTPLLPQPSHNLHPALKQPSLSRTTSAAAALVAADNPNTGEYSVSLPARLIYQYANPLLRKAKNTTLETTDALPVPDARRMESSVTDLAQIYQQLRHKARATLAERQAAGTDTSLQAYLLTKALVIHQRRRLIFSGILRLINTAVQAFPALLVARLLRLVEAGLDQPASKALTAALTLVAVLTLKMITENQYFHTVVKLSTQVRGSLAGLIFDKALRLPGGGAGLAQDQAALGVGGVLNLMQSDTSIVESAALQIHTTWDGLLQLAIYSSLLYRFLGPSVFYGMAVLLATIPLNSLTLRILHRLARRENQAKDARNKRTAEAVAHMKLLKLFGWEDRFADDIDGHRRDELARHAARGVVRAVNSAISNAVPAVVLVVTLTAYARAGQPIVASTIFTAISLFNQLRFPLFFYPMLIDALANGRTATMRIANFLAAEEITPYVEKRPAVSNGGSIEMRNGNFLWSVVQGKDQATQDEAVPALANVNVAVQPGEIVAVIGTVGSGKSALIKGLLGELSPVPSTLMQANLHEDASHAGAPVNPSVVTHGNIAYCSQEAWLPKGTIREAIVFGREYDEERYRSAIYDAGLDKDIVDSLEEADPKKGQLSHETDVGEHGSALSGGQRARVSLARALYAGNDTQVFLLDDVLAALDANVGSIVFERLTRRLRKQKAAVLLVTNDPSIPRRCDRVILMGKVDSSSSSSCSTVIDQGTYDELRARGRKLEVAKAKSSDAVVDANAESEWQSASNLTDVTDTFMAAEYGDNMTSLSQISAFNDSSVLPFNDTVCIGYADPERQVSMENCPDSCNTDGIQSNCITDIDHDKVQTVEMTEMIAVYNNTHVSMAKSSAKETAHDGTAETEASKAKYLKSVDEQMSTGAIPISTYFSYLRAVRSPALIVAMLGSYLTVNGAQFFQQYTVAKWSEAASTGIGAAMGASYLQSLLNAAVVVSVFLWFRSYLLMRVGLRASSFLHGRMLKSVFRAPLSFFSSTSSGTLMSRFGKELETVDRGVPDSIGSVLFCFLQIFTSIGALAGVVTPAMLVPLALVGVFYVRTMSLFRPAARDMKRAETKTRSPIYTHFGKYHANVACPWADFSRSHSFLHTFWVYRRSFKRICNDSLRPGC